MSRPYMFFQMDKRVTIEYQALIVTEIHGTIRGSAELTTGPTYADDVAEIIKNFPRCKEFTVVAGSDITLVLAETTIKKEFPSEDIYSKDQLQDTVGRFGIFELMERKRLTISSCSNGNLRS